MTRPLGNHEHDRSDAESMGWNRVPELFDDRASGLVVHRVTRRVLVGVAWRE